MPRFGAGLLIAAVVASVVFALQKYYLSENADAGSTDPAPVVQLPAEAPADAVQTAVTTDDAAEARDETTPVAASTLAPAPTNGLSEDVLASEREAFHKRFDLATLGTDQLSDGEINAIVGYLKNDPLLLEQFLQQYRENTDPDRAKRLALILEQFDDETITSIAEELVFSGEINSQQAGLDLLGDQQVHNPAAREMVSQVLEIESNPEVLVSALNALAKPGAATAEQTERLLNQFVMHSTSDDETVRSHSLSLMARWGGDREMNEHYLAGLSDSSEQVRRSAVFLLGNSKHPNDSIKAALREVLENSNESPRLRRNALSNLKKLGLSKEEEAQYRSRIAAGN